MNRQGRRIQRPCVWGCLFSFCLLVGCGSDRPTLAGHDSSPSSSTPAAQAGKRLQTDDSDDPVRPANYQPIPEPNPAQVAVRVLAQVNGIAILDKEVKEACYPQLMATQSLPEPEQSARRAEIIRQTLQQIIEREVILQDL